MEEQNLEHLCSYVHESTKTKETLVLIDTETIKLNICVFLIRDTEIYYTMLLLEQCLQASVGIVSRSPLLF